MKIVHLTSAHDRYDIRIFVKMCCSLARHGWDVSLVVADGLGDEEKNGVKIYDAGPKQVGRIARMTKTVNSVFEKAKELNADIYQLHDPELMTVCSRLKKMGKKVVFDAHEDLPKQIMGKPYLNFISKQVISLLIGLYERFICSRLDGVLTATPIIREKFLQINPNTIDINNFPVLGELANEGKWSAKKNEVCYVGGITEIRGIKEIVAAMEHTKDVSLNLVGSFSEDLVKTEVKKHPGWTKVKEFGELSRREVADIMSISKVGLVTFLPLPNHIDAQPNKMFEYMSAGIPIITSNFPLWKLIVEGNHCGICVDPLNPAEIGEAIQSLVTNDELAEKMGENGKRAVIEKYNWGSEEKKLFKFYNDLVIE
ncbi:MAG: glycosyltransferase family 4 protein [Chitinophagales bacterium]|nr:glycosyltransferase family 4 protein [Chitinophagales bacterium]